MITDRQDAVAELSDNHYLRQELRGALRTIMDIQRLNARVATGKATPKCLRSLGEGLSRVAEISSLLSANKASAKLVQPLVSYPPVIDAISAKITSTIVSNPNTNAKGGGIIAPGANAAIDDMKNDLLSGASWGDQDKRDRTLPYVIVNFEDQERKRTGIGSLKVIESKMGYFITIPRRLSKTVTLPDDYDRKQTLTNEERYTTPALLDIENRILKASEELLLLEFEAFKALVDETAKIGPVINTIAEAIGSTDVLAGFAQRAVDDNYCRPLIFPKDARQLAIIDGRHPVVEALLPDPSDFIPNSTALAMNGDGKFKSNQHKLKDRSSEYHFKLIEDRLQTSRADLILLTGPNAGGKSVYLKQIGIIQVLAQIGSYVPASKAKVSICDRIFTRVGGVDDMAGAKSTFMVEMTETAEILNNATQHSLVLLDEVGRGTATYDGLAIAWSVCEHLALRVKSKCVFATHYHELNKLATMHHEIACLQVEVEEAHNKVVFQYQIGPGGANKSYGIHVASLAHFPPEVTARAHLLLDDIEKRSSIKI